MSSIAWEGTYIWYSKLNQKSVGPEGIGLSQEPSSLIFYTDVILPSNCILNNCVYSVRLVAV